jgi:hypothetical protein
MAATRLQFRLRRPLLPLSTKPLGNEGLSRINRVRFSSIRQLLSGRCFSDRPLRLVIFGDPIALNVRRRTEISVHQDAPFSRRCSANRTLEIERRIIPGHASLLPLFGQRMMANSEHSACEHSAVCLPSNALTLTLLNRRDIQQKHESLSRRRGSRWAGKGLRVN